MVRWNGNYSAEFNNKNGVKQGAMLSALLYCVYVDDLFLHLRKNRQGCWINGEFMEIFGYADYNVLLSPTLDGLQNMLNIREQYAKEHNLSFSTNENINKCKTKCMAFTKKERDLRSMMLCGNSLPWVKSMRHLGNKIEDKIDGTRQDMREKRSQFIQKNNEICQEFYFADSTTKIRLNNMLNTHFTCSPIWDLFCGEADVIEKTWNVAMRKMMKLNRCSHRFLIEPLSQTRHIKFSLMKRFINFTHKILNSTKTSLKTLYNCIKKDCRSITGNTLRNIMLQQNVNNIESISMKAIMDMEYHKAGNPEEECRINMVEEMIKVKRGKLQLENFNNTEIDQLLDCLCTT